MEDLMLCMASFSRNEQRLAWSKYNLSPNRRPKTKCSQIPRIVIISAKTWHEQYQTVSLYISCGLSLKFFNEMQYIHNYSSHGPCSYNIPIFPKTIKVLKTKILDMYLKIQPCICFLRLEFHTCYFEEIDIM